MKRSEMLGFISEFLREECGLLPQTSALASEVLLCIVEEKGMLPPPYERPPTRGMFFQWEEE